VKAAFSISIALTILLATGSHSAPADEPLQTVLKKYGGWGGVSGPGNIAAMSDDERSILIAAYRRRLEDVGQKYKDDRFTAGAETRFVLQELRKLGDPEALAEMVRILTVSPTNSPEYRHGLSDMEHAARPEVLKSLAPLIFVDEPLVFIPIGPDTGAAVPRSYSIARLLLRITERSPRFTLETRKWAEENCMVSLQRMVPMVRQWWQENEKAMFDGEYKKVRPGIDVRKQEREERAR
jgi:hypothetical protein